MSGVQVCTEDYRVLGQHQDRIWWSTISKEMRNTHMDRNQAHIHMLPFTCSVLSEQPSDLLVAWLAPLKNNDVSLSSTSLAVRTGMIHVQSIRERRCPISILLIMILYDGHTVSSSSFLSETMHLLLQRLHFTCRMEFLSPSLLYKCCDHFASDQLYIKMLKSPRVHHLSNADCFTHTPKTPHT